MSQQVSDPSTLSYEELAKLANEELAGHEEQVTSNEEQPSSEEEQPVDEVVYRRVIDLGDGSGTQVFEGATPEELIEKLAEAQVNATRKIRELAAAKKEAPAAPVEPNPDEEFVLSQEFLQSPTKAFAKLFQKNTGMTIEEFKAEQAKLSRVTQEQQDFNAGREFVLSTPDYFNSDRNNARLEKWLRVEGLQPTIENLRKAYADLNESGLLESRPANVEENAVEPTTRREAQPRIAAPQKVVGQRRAASGLSSRGGSPSAPRPQEPTMDELYNMPLDKLEALARKSQGI